MVLKFNNFSWSSSSGDQPQPPFGAPTGHFGDVTDNIARENLAATNDLGQAVFGADLGGVAHSPGDAVVLQSDGDVNFSDINQLKTEFAQLIYDVANPVKTIRMTNTTLVDSVSDILNPSNLSVTWSPCDGGTYNSIVTPDLRDKVIAGADPGTGVHTGAVSAADGTMDDQVDQTALVSSSELSKNCITHGHGDDFKLPDHSHKIPTGGGDYADARSNVDPVGGTIAGSSIATGRASSTGNVNSATMPGITGGVDNYTGLTGAASKHSHTLPDLTHAHGLGTASPLRTHVEFWIRTA